MGELETARTILSRAGGRPAAAAEQFNFEHLDGSGAINFDEGPSAAARGSVNGAGHALLSGSSFPSQQDGDVGFCDPSDEVGDRTVRSPIRRRGDAGTRGAQRRASRAAASSGRSPSVVIGPPARGKGVGGVAPSK